MTGASASDWIKRRKDFRVGPGNCFPKPLTDRAENWRASSNKPFLDQLFFRSFVIFTVSPYFVSSSRHVKRSVRISRTTLSYYLSAKTAGKYIARIAMQKKAERQEMAVRELDEFIERLADNTDRDVTDSEVQSEMRKEIEAERLRLNTKYFGVKTL